MKFKQLLNNLSQYRAKQSAQGFRNLYFYSNQQTLQLMFFFASCCQHFQTGEGYQVRQSTINQKPVFNHSLEDIQKDALLKSTNQIIKIKRSQYEELIHSFKDTKKMWIDQQFLPEKVSLGDLHIEAKWKRLTEIVQHPSIFTGKLSPFIMMADYVQEIFVQNSFYCTIAALLERQEIIKNLFAGVSYSKAGLYKVPLRINGQIEEVIIDDFIPIRNNGVPIFSSSNSNEIWLYLLEKVWAKVNGGYSNINTTPRQIMKAFAWAPCDQIYLKPGEDQSKKLWQTLLNASSKKFPCVCQTICSEEQSNQISEAGLLQSQFYGMLEAFNIEDQKGRPHQVLKMRSFISVDGLKIDIRQGHNLWNLVVEYEKGRNWEISEARKENIFYIRYQDFIKYFTKISFSYYESNSNYLSETILSDFSRGFLYKFDVTHEGRYNIELHQPQPSEYKLQENQHPFKRGTVILIEDLNGQLSYIDGILTINQKDSLLSADLPPGKYLLYCKLDFNKQAPLSTQYSISLYSKYFAKILKTQRKAYPNILQRAFLYYGRLNPRNKHNNDLMWISYRLFYKQGGFAFIAVGNKSQSTKKFLITFDEKDFIKMNFKLKKPFKKVDQVQMLEVLPGEEKIILARCANTENLKSLKFPPQLGIKIQPIDHK